ncbi:MAG TPA: hypothetical protein VK698_39255 [Kofleriaceae bacterium]|nr:hypothetical protein [Kofleriaceae bacterium]
MSDTVRIAFGVCGLVGGTAGLIGAYIVWRTGRRSIDNLKKRLGLTG